MNEYQKFHRNRVNLLIHLAGVPVFVVCLVGAVWNAVAGQFLMAGVLLLGPIISMILQGVGHKMEKRPPEPFAGPWNVISRIMAEQFYKFPLFVLSGRWGREWSDGGNRE